MGQYESDWLTGLWRGWSKGLWVQLPAVYSSSASSPCHSWIPALTSFPVPGLLSYGAGLGAGHVTPSWSLPMALIQTPQACTQELLYSSFSIHGSTALRYGLEPTASWSPILPDPDAPAGPICEPSPPSLDASSSETPLLVPYPELIFPVCDPVFQPGPVTPLLFPAVSSSVGHESGCSSLEARTRGSVSAPKSLAQAKGINVH